jgi:hypothetical protein
MKRLNWLESTNDITKRSKRLRELASGHFVDSPIRSMEGKPKAGRICDQTCLCRWWQGRKAFASRPDLPSR